MDIIQKATNGPAHHFFGFHDLIAFNRSGDKILSLEVDTINHPPLKGEKAKVGYTRWEEQQFVALGETNAFNYPQGARQQWLSDMLFTVNNQIGDHWGTDIYDVEIGKIVQKLDAPTHCLSRDGKTSYSFNYSRVFRLGGYGYTGLPDHTENESIPSNDGIYATDISSNSTKLLVSIEEIANCDKATSAFNGFHHYITHLTVSPDGQRIAFLHRFVLADGGVRTRLMTIGANGNDLRCIAQGFLSHFDWKDNQHIIIWGRIGNNADKLRSAGFLSSPLLAPFVKTGKNIIKKIIGKKSGMLAQSFLMIEDSESPTISSFANGIICSDGHPMFCPTNRNLFICDTYPDEHKERTLFFYNFEDGTRTDVGKFRMIDERPDMTLQATYFDGLDKNILSLFTPEQLAFTRSGLHCDLHPRWDANGKMVAFDSIHEGSRQIYVAHNPFYKETTE